MTFTTWVDLTDMILCKGTNSTSARAGIFWTSLAPECFLTAAVMSLGPIQFQQAGSYFSFRCSMATCSTGWWALKAKALFVTDILPLVTVSL